MSYGDKAANINVFFVNKYEYDDTPDENDVTGRQYSKGIFIEDLLVHPWATITSVLAHEIAHYLGVGESHYRKNRNIDGLMYFRARGGVRISKVHTNMINSLSFALPFLLTASASFEVFYGTDCSTAVKFSSLMSPAMFTSEVGNWKFLAATLMTTD